MDVRFTDESIGYLSDRGYEPEFGARPLRRTIQRLVENRLSRMVLDGTLEEGDSVVVSVKDGHLEFTPEKGPAAETREERGRPAAERRSKAA